MTQRPRCRNPSCDAPHIACNMGEESVDNCKWWSSATEKSLTGETPKNSQLLTWHGEALGALDLEVVSGRSTPRLLGLIGPHNAGKTTLLTTLYLLLGKGARIAGRRFAGSYTLAGWEGLAQALRWSPGAPPQFPPHTSRVSGRAPGLLHLALRLRGARLEDVILTDAPGEWFDTWALKETSPGAAGARWTVNHSHSLILVLDCEALSGEERGVARQQVLRLTQRLASHRRGRRVAVVWAKSDQAVPTDLRQSITSRLASLLPGFREFETSIYRDAESAAASVMPLFEWAVGDNETSVPELAASPEVSSDPFLSFREPEC